MQLDEKGFIVKKGTIQDATFITSDPGQKRNKKDQQGQDKKDQNLEAIKASQIKDFDKDLLNLQIILLIAMPNQRGSMEGQLMKEVGQKKAANPSSAIRVIF